MKCKFSTCPQHSLIWQKESQFLRDTECSMELSTPFGAMYCFNIHTPKEGHAQSHYSFRKLNHQTRANLISAFSGSSTISISQYEYCPAWQWEYPSQDIPDAYSRTLFQAVSTPTSGKTKNGTTNHCENTSWFRDSITWLTP